MLVKFFGIMDLLCAIGIVLLQFDLIAWNFAFAAMAYLAAKAYMFRESMLSLIDGACAVYILFMMFGLHHFLAYILAAYLVQKGFFSFL